MTRAALTSALVIVGLTLGPAATVNARDTSALPGACAHARLRFTGNGSRDIAPIRVIHNSTFYWQAGGHYFFAANRRASPDLNIISSGLHGTSYMPAGRYQLAVGAVGAWTICILPG